MDLIAGQEIIVTGQHESFTPCIGTSCGVDAGSKGLMGFFPTECVELIDDSAGGISGATGASSGLGCGVFSSNLPLPPLQLRWTVASSVCARLDMGTSRPQPTSTPAYQRTSTPAHQYLRAATDGREDVAAAMTKSSLSVDFIVVSDGKFLASVDAPSAALQAKVEAFVTATVNRWVAEGVFLIADFEGEMMGWGGELQVAQFLPTTSIDATTLKRSTSSMPDMADLGLLVDARSAFGIRVIRHIMGLTTITKLIWGADNDIISLKFHPHLLITCHNVIDVQLGFCDPSNRKGMAAMLRNFPNSTRLALLPAKDADVAKYHPQARNCRCNTYPMDSTEALYCMDDVHRIDIILHSGTPTTSDSYQGAKHKTDAFLRMLTENAPETALNSLRNELRYYDIKSGVGKDCSAVALTRSIVAIKMRLGDTVPLAHQYEINSMMNKCADHIRLLRLSITSLAWANDSEPRFFILVMSH
jgi:hypothetical protein